MHATDSPREILPNVIWPALFSGQIYIISETHFKIFFIISIND